ncbi:MAG TPA: hypothetical protein PLC28_12725 [Spirochaetota bacterium]|nr:hypothetical protein [Spirochaetota bacterium]HPC42035.1 hypothetical protein [Spirochaetota bacterium]HPL18208.1 hypothetical protein [Spirochaetota bacterium]HRS78351.1 hypothetical protein [Spirochaetota bacterium]HRT76571.1 hypothetical protein [Spirochaetota bacterium]
MMMILFLTSIAYIKKETFILIKRFGGSVHFEGPRAVAVKIEKTRAGG